MDCKVFTIYPHLKILWRKLPTSTFTCTLMEKLEKFYIDFGLQTVETFQCEECDFPRQRLLINSRISPFVLTFDIAFVIADSALLDPFLHQF